jgi:hypothetical protein
MNTIVKGKYQNGRIYLKDRPKNIHNSEIIVTFLDDEVTNDFELTSLNNSARGALKKYARIDLINEEKNAWEIAMKEKHAH